MKKYIAIETATGRVDAVYEVGDDGNPPVFDDHDVLPAGSDFDKGWPPAPSDTAVLHVLDGNLQWVETATLEEVRQRKRQEITACRIAADNDHFVYQDKMIRTADKDMFDLLVADARINKCTDGKMPPNWPGGWKAMDNSYLPISSPDAWNAFFIAAYDAGIGNFMKSQSLKQQIDSATTFQEIEAIKW